LPIVGVNHCQPENRAQTHTLGHTMGYPADTLAQLPLDNCIINATLLRRMCLLRRRPFIRASRLRAQQTHSYKYNLTPRAASVRWQTTGMPPRGATQASNHPTTHSLEQIPGPRPHSSHKHLGWLTQMFCLPMLIGLNATQAHFASPCARRPQKP